MTIHSRDAIIATGVIELVGKDEQIDQNEYSASVAVPVNADQKGGVIRGVTLIQTETGGGAILSVAGHLFFFNSDPASAAGDTALTAAEHKTVVGKLTIAASDWVTDANGGIAYFANVEIAFPALENLYAVFKLTSATSINSDAGDDEVLEVNIFYENLKNQ